MYDIRPAALADIPHLVRHREGMFRDMGTECDYPAMLGSFERWLRLAMPDGTYRGWLAQTQDGRVVAGVGLIVLPWPPGPRTLDPRCAFVYNVYTDHDHRRRGLARRLMETLHAWCRAQGIGQVGLTASDEGRALYESMGYEAEADYFLRLTP